MTPFDLIIPMGILLATFLSDMPKKAAILLCLLSSATMIWVDYFTEGWAFYWSSLAIEFSAFVLLMVSARMLRRSRDRIFYRLMAVFFLLSYGVTGTFIFMDSMSHEVYANISHGIAVAHVLAMLSMSDGIRNLADVFGDWLLALRGRFRHQGH